MREPNDDAPRRGSERARSGRRRTRQGRAVGQNPHGGHGLVLSDAGLFVTALHLHNNAQMHFITPKYIQLRQNNKNIFSD